MRKIIAGLFILNALLLGGCIVHVNDGDQSSVSISNRERYLMKTVSLDAASLNALKGTSTSADFSVYGDGNGKAYVEMYAQGQNSNLSKSSLEAILQDKYEIEISQDGQVAVVNAKRKSGFNWDGKQGINIYFKIHVPAAITTDIRTTSGDLYLKGLKGNQSFTATSADVKAEQIDGSFSANTSSGDIRLSQVSGPSLDLAATSGDVDLSSCTAGNIRIRTSSGDISFDDVHGNSDISSASGDQKLELVNGSLSSVSGSGDQQITIVHPQDGIRLSAGSGDIQLSLPQRIGAELDIKGSSVSMPSISNFSGDFSKGKSIYGKMNGGGMPVYIRTGSGDIRLSWK